MPITKSLPAFDYVKGTDSRWKLKNSKDKGANPGGSLAGLYEVKLDDNSIIRVYLKQDDTHDKNIAEVLASQLMRAILKETGRDESLVARVDYVPMPSTEKENKPYIASYVVDGYIDLFKDAHLAIRLEEYEPIRSQVFGSEEELPPVPNKRPRYLSKDLVIETLMELGRYKAAEMEIVLAVRLIVDDPDVHYENFGTYPSEKKVTSITHEGITENVPSADNAKLIAIDFGGAFGDSRRGFDGHIHLNAFSNFFRYYPSFQGPPSYINQLPDFVLENGGLFIQLEAFSRIDASKLDRVIDEQLLQAKINYQNDPKIILDFAKRIGCRLDPKDGANCDELIETIGWHLKTNLRKRQNHARQLFLEFLFATNSSKREVIIKAERAKSSAHSLVLADDSRSPSLRNSFLDWVDKDKPGLIETFNAIYDLEARENIGSAKISLNNLIGLLDKELARAVLGKKEPEIQLHTRFLCDKTKQLLKDYKTCVESIESNNEPESSLNEFLKKVKVYEKDCSSLSTNKKIILAACVLAGTLVGVAIGLALGTIAGVAVGGGGGSVFPFLGTLIGAVGAGSIAGVLGALKGAGIGGAVGAAAGAIILGFVCGDLGHSIGHYSLFSDTNKATANLANSLRVEASKIKPKTNL